MDWLENLSSISLSTQTELPDFAICPLPSWGTITFVGEDKKSYLQGQVTCDVVSLELSESTYGAHCDAKGKMWSIFNMFHHNEGYAMVHRKSALTTELTEIKSTQYSLKSPSRKELMYWLVLAVTMPKVGLTRSVTNELMYVA